MTIIGDNSRISRSLWGTGWMRSNVFFHLFVSFEKYHYLCGAENHTDHSKQT